MVLWLGYKKYVDKYVDNTGSIQSYDGMKLSLLREVFTIPENSVITYLKSVTDTFVDAIIHRDILIHGSRDILHKNQIRNKQFEVNL